MIGKKNETRKFIVAAVYDNVLGAYIAPIPFDKKEKAIQYLKSATRSGGLIGTCAEDYRIDMIGTWEPETGKLESCPIKTLAKATEFK